MTQSTSATINKCSEDTVMARVDAILTDTPPRATSLIVTIYGDVVEPRGGVLWMGTLIDCCARHGISESLVRTAVWRLVSAGKLEGQRIGRKSYYRLSVQAQAEFRHAARILFSPLNRPSGWLIALDPGDASLPAEWVPLAGSAMVAPRHQDTTMPPGPVLQAETISDDRAMAELAMQKWSLDQVGQSYRDFITRYIRIREAGNIDAVPDDDALALRLRMMDEYRHAVLADPGLPAAALPGDWPDSDARQVFRDIYLALSPAAERCIANSFADSRGLLAMTSAETVARADALRTD